MQHCKYKLRIIEQKHIWQLYFYIWLLCAPRNTRTQNINPIQSFNFLKYACEGAQSHACFHMPPQIACLGGYMITLVAFLRCAFSNVSSNGCVNGCIITLVAFVWLFFTVGFQMCPQSAGIKGCICSIFLHCVFSIVSSKHLHKRMHNHAGCIWKHTVEKSLTSATNVSMHPIRHPIWEHVCSGRSTSEVALVTLKWPF